MRYDDERTDSRHMNNIQPLVSIIISNYNYAAFLSEAIDSALGQTYSNIEIIVVDDGSKDNSRELLQPYSQSVRLIFKENGGMGSALNAGFKDAKGELVMFLDADDILYPNTIAELVKLWRPGVSKIHFRLQCIDQDGRMLPSILPRTSLPFGNLIDQLCTVGHYTSAPGSGNLYHRALLDEVMPIANEASWRGFADGYLILLAPLFGEIEAYQGTLGLYRVHTNSHTNIGSDAASAVVKLRNDLRQDLLLRETVAAVAARKGKALGKQAFTGSWKHLKHRFAACKLGGPGDPYPGDSILSSATQFAKAVLKTPELTVRAKAEFIVWIGLVTVLPSRLVRSLVFFGISTSFRNSVMQRMRLSSAALPQPTAR